MKDTSKGVLRAPLDVFFVNGVSLFVVAEIRLAEGRKMLLEFVKFIDKYKYKEV